MNSKKSFTVDQIREKMAAYCVYQDRCHWEVERKLDSYFLIPEAKDDILIYLIQHNFLNEERFTENFSRGKFYQKSWGKIKISNELKKRNIPRKLIQKGLEQIDEADYHKTIKHLIQKKSNLIQEKNKFKKNQKIIRYMIQKGYEYSLIISHLEEL